MKKIFLLAIGILLLSSCSESPCDISQCKFTVGEDVKIKHKTFHNKATVTRVGCGCTYVVSYYSTLSTRRHRNV